jgi:P-type Cu2+ transporter
VEASPQSECSHCGLPLVTGTDVQDGEPGSNLKFCCPGCVAAHDLVAGLGLDQYYQRRVLDDAARPLKPDDSQEGLDFSLYAEEVEKSGKIQTTLSLVIDGFQCAACGWLIEQVLARDLRVSWGRVNMTTQRLNVTWAGPAGLANDILSPVLKLGYRLFPFDVERVEAERLAHETALLKALGVAGFAAANVMLLSIAIWAGYSQGMGPATRGLMHWVSALIALPAVVYAGQSFFRSALTALAARRVNMDVPISLAVILTSGMSLFQVITGAEYAYFDSAIGLLFFLLIGRYLDSRARSRARSSAAHLLALTARPVTVIQPDGSTTTQRPEAVRPDMIILTAAGERISVDGTVSRGTSEIDQSLLTGETLPVTVSEGDPVYAGTLNIGQALQITVTASSSQTALAEIVRLLEQAEEGRARYVELAERVSRLYAPVVHTLGLATFLGWLLVGASWQTAMLYAIAVLIITCPCALALAVPAVQVVAAGRLLRRGILLKSATALERLAEVDSIAFDKTGTLTIGKPVLIGDYVSADLTYAMNMAASSRHPLSRALVRAGNALGLQSDTSVMGPVEEVAGGGLRANLKGETWKLGSRSFCDLPEAATDADETGDNVGPQLWFVRPGQAPVCFRFEDEVRADAGDVIQNLKSAGYEMSVLSGDRAAVVAALSARIGVQDHHAELSPADKFNWLSDRATAGRKVLMVGDGLNDAPALAAAYVSLSPATAADISQAASDVVFQGDKLLPVQEVLIVAKRAQKIIRQNIIFSFAYNALCIPIAISGLVTPLFAAVAMSVSSLIVLTNSLRLGRINEQKLKIVYKNLHNT